MMHRGNLGQAIENPSCEVVELVVQECCMAWFFLSNLTGSQYACECCGSQVAGIVGDPFLANAMEVHWLIFQLYEKEQVDQCLAT